MHESPQHHEPRIDDNIMISRHIFSAGLGGQLMSNSSSYDYAWPWVADDRPVSLLVEIASLRWKSPSFFSMYQSVSTALSPIIYTIVVEITYLNQSYFQVGYLGGSASVHCREIVFLKPPTIWRHCDFYEYMIYISAVSTIVKHIFNVSSTSHCSSFALSFLANRPRCSTIFSLCVWLAAHFDRSAVLAAEILILICKADSICYLTDTSRFIACHQNI